MGQSVKCTLPYFNMWFSYWKIIESFCIYILPNTVIHIEDKTVSSKKTALVKLKFKGDKGTNQILKLHN